jgi:hypothetical protein
MWCIMSGEAVELTTCAPYCVVVAVALDKPRRSAGMVAARIFESTCRKESFFL